MKIVAITVKGHEWMYAAATAHRVAEKTAQKVCDALNSVRFHLKTDNDIWHVYDIGTYEYMDSYASFQKFTIGKNGHLKRVVNY